MKHMSDEPRLLDLLAAARDRTGDLQRRTIAKCVRQHRCGTLGVVEHCDEFDPDLVHRAKMEEKDFVDKMRVYDVVPRSDAATKGCRVIRTRWVMATGGRTTNLSYAQCGLHWSFVPGTETEHGYFSEAPDLALVKTVTAHAARWAVRGDTVVAVFDVRRAYFHAKKKRNTFVELPDNWPAEVRVSHVGKLRMLFS